MGKKTVRILLGILVIGAAILGAYGYIVYDRWNSPWGNAAEDTFMLEVKEGMTARQIGETLREKGIVDNVSLFLVIADLRGIADKLKAGEYEMKYDKTPYEIMDMLARGEAYRRALVIPEGFTQLQIAESCEKLEICTKDDFLQECRNNNVFNFVVAQAPGNANAACEGVLYPDTYYFIRNTPPDRIVNRMRTTFQGVWDPLYDEVIGDATATEVWWIDSNSQPLVNEHKVVVLASMVEREAKRKEDQPLIASVLVNRLKQGMPLQVDSTIHYAMNDWTRPLTYSDLEFDSPYNTYKNTGLPPAAICNPGKDALRAAMRPPQTDYLYFIANDQGETLFTKSLDEHNTLKAQFKKDRREKEAAAKNAG